MRLQLSGSRRRLLAIACAALLVGVIGVGVYFVLSIERQLAESSDRIVVEVDELRVPEHDGVTLWMPDQPARDVEPFAGGVYAATASGLCVYDDHGHLTKRFTTLDGLPENALTCLERFDGQLFIGTEHSGMLAYDGQRFVRYRFVKPSSQRVTALRAINGRLLVGTFENGLFEYDGADFSRDFQRVAGPTAKCVTAILDEGPRVFVGTFDHGLFEWREGSVKHVGSGEGLPSDRVTALCLSGQALLVGTDRGVGRIDSNDTVATIDGTANVTGVAMSGPETWVSSLTSGVRRIEGLDGGLVTRPASLSVGTPGGTPAANGLKREDGILWSLRDDGLYTSIKDGEPARFERFDEPGNDGPSTTAGHVSGLALDGAGRLWVGLFDGGVSVLDADSGAGVWRFATPEVQEVNAVVAAEGGRRIWVGSSSGLSLFDNGTRVRTLGEKSGLASQNVAGISLDPTAGEGVVTLATSEGVSQVDGPVTRSVTAFHGLPSNHTYAVAAVAGKTYVGTLGGLAQLNGLRIERVYSTANSRLPHNWVNAIVAASGRVYVGTYGGGVAVVLPGGDIQPEEPTKGLEVNPGAMALVGSRLFVGTLRSGVWMLDIDSHRWTKVESVLSSDNVTAIAANDRYVFLGTENGITRIELRRLGMGNSQ